MAVPPDLPSPALTACLCSMVSMSTVHQHRAHHRLRAAVPVWTANRANSFTSIAKVRLPRSQRRCVIFPRATVSDRAFTDFLIDASDAASRLCDGRAARPRPRCLCHPWSHCPTADQVWQRARISIKYQRFQCFRYRDELPVPPACPARRARHRSRHHWAAECPWSTRCRHHRCTDTQRVLCSVLRVPNPQVWRGGQCTALWWRCVMLVSLRHPRECRDIV
jgi:hypothetical protein